MKTLIFTVAATFLFSVSNAQRLSKITLANGNSDIMSFLTDDAVFINVGMDGKVIDWGVESTSMYNNYPGKLDPYMGRIEYYASTDNEDVRGKVKYIGLTSITYFTAGENEFFKGKVKSIGTIYFDYYDKFNDEAVKGKIKNAGTYTLSFYSSFDNEAFKGKLKNVGPSALTYYASFEDKAYKGKIKSIDNQKFTYYSSFDRREFQGSMKGGGQREYIINGIKYYLKN
jgi:hypothetical protein